MRVNILASNNFFERRIDTENIYRNAVQFQILGKYMFVTKYAGNDKKHLDLFVSVSPVFIYPFETRCLVSF